MIEIDARLYNALLSLLALTLFITSYYLTTRLLFKKVEYYLEFFIPLLFLIVFFSMNLSMFLIDSIIGSEMKMITLSETEFIKHITLISASLSVVGSVFAVLSRD
jgi:hypothetical protein